MEHPSMPENKLFIHPTAEVSPEATIGEGTKIWNEAQVREEATIGQLCVISKGVYIDKGVIIGDRVKVQNNVSVFQGVEIKDGVFVGPHVCFTNDLYPRAVNAEGELAGEDDWEVAKTLIEKGASIGANSTIIAGHSIGSFALIGAGSVVTKDIPEYSLAAGNPAVVVGAVNRAGEIIARY